MALNDFKAFVKQRPNLADFVNSNQMTWQKFYEMYELYGAESNVWNQYLNSINNNSLAFKDIFGMFKNMNMNDLQDGITSIQKGIGYIQDMIKNKTVEDSPRTSSYEPRPIYKQFDD